jgi:hypothetical protein
VLFVISSATQVSPHTKKKYCTAVHSFLMRKTEWLKCNSQTLHDKDTNKKIENVASLVMVEGNLCLTAHQQWGTTNWEIPNRQKCRLHYDMLRKGKHIYKQYQSNLKGKWNISLSTYHRIQQTIITTASQSCGSTFSLNPLIYYKITFCNVL